MSSTPIAMIWRRWSPNELNELGDTLNQDLIDGKGSRGESQPGEIRISGQYEP